MRLSILILILLAGSAGAATQPATKAGIAPAPANPLAVAEADATMPDTSLTPEAAEALRRKVLLQCGLSEDATASLPWYFHFEYGRELLSSGDARRAVAELSRAVDLNPVPHAAKRMYGMWYVDYFPYYQLALAHSELGNWSCAANAMRLSQMSELSGTRNFDLVKYAALRRQIEGKAPYTEACTKDDPPQ